VRPFRSVFMAGVLAVAVITSLAGCAPSIVGSQPLSGDAAVTAMHKVLDASLAKEAAVGMTEEHTIGDTKFILVFDPTAPEGKQVAGMDETQGVGVFDTPAALSLNKLKAFIDSLGTSLGTVAYDGTSFSIHNANFTIVLMVKNDLIEGSAITGAANATPQLVANTYSFSDVAKQVLHGAVVSTAAPTPAPVAVPEATPVATPVASPVATPVP